ncbi:MAG: hypothetical protein Fur0041_11490 [Bacteroidia bacterium]
MFTLKQPLKIFVFTLLQVLMFQLPVMASHLMGGEITWTCQGNGQFVFNMKLYRDCNGATGPPNANLTVFNHPTLTTIAMNLVAQNDISPQCNAIGPQISCASAQAQPGWPSSATPVAGAVEEFIYQSNPIFISGTPPAQGWVFTYSNCCRNAAITNLQNPNALGFTLRAIMYPYNASNTNPCYDSSPTFLESPKTIICTGYPFTYNHNAVDPELDSLAYSWDQPLDQMAVPPVWNPPASPAPVTFAPTFAFNNPMPGPTLNANNVPATINPATGEISYTSYTTGNFVTCIKVEAWKCGQKVAEIFREIQVILLPCGNNTPPVVTPPLQSNTTFYDTVYAGQLVTFNLNAIDPDLLPNGNPQTMTLDATGQQFGAGFTNPNAGCLNPPCATLNAPPPVSGQGNVGTTFNWQTDCNHVYFTNLCLATSNTYNFIFKVTDDFCPAPALKIATVSITVLAQPLVLSPEVRCLAVQPNGDVVITWEQPLDTAATFNSYHIFTAANPNGPFTPLDSVFNYNQTSYTHAGANANNGPVYYYVQTRSGCAGQVMLPPLDTMSTIYLQVTNNNNVTANLTWNNISNPAPSTQYSYFKIYREYPTGVWTLLDSTQSLSYVDSVAFCNNIINYRIEIGDSLGCVSISNIDGDLFIDNILPAIPNIDSVSVNGLGDAVIGWTPSSSQDVIGYVVYQYINGIWTAVDTVFGINSTFYSNAISNASAQSENYVIAAFDSCGNISAFSSNHNTLYLTAALNICNAEVTLNWNEYINMPGGLGGYEVYFSENGGPWTLAGTTPAGDSSFVHSGLNQFSTYCYYIVAYNTSGDITSRSNTKCVFANVPQQPAFNYLRVATVASQNLVEIRAYVDVAADVTHYDVYRADSINGTWALIGSVLAAPPNSLVIYQDNTAETELQSYYYKMIAVDSCGEDAFTSNIGRTIFAEASGDREITNTVTWNDYEQWPVSVLHYNIFRSVDGVMDPNPVGTVPFTGAGTNTFVDDVSAYIGFTGKFAYLIEAVESPGNPFFLTDTAYSNWADVIQQPLVYVPNAFSPNGNGLNDVFIPSTGFIDIEEYEFSVFNRWGEQIFTTDNRYTGWDGRYKGTKCEPGVYVWILTFKTAAGQYIDRKGTVTLLR